MCLHQHNYWTEKGGGLVWREGSEIKNTCCSCKRPEYGSRQLHLVAVNCLTPYFQWLWYPLLTSVDTRTHVVHKHTLRHTLIKIFFQRKRLNFHRGRWGDTFVKKSTRYGREDAEMLGWGFWKKANLFKRIFKLFAFIIFTWASIILYHFGCVFRKSRGIKCFWEAQWKSVRMTHLLRLLRNQRQNWLWKGWKPESAAMEKQREWGQSLRTPTLPQGALHLTVHPTSGSFS